MTGTFHSLSPAKNPTHCSSGDKEGHDRPLRACDRSGFEPIKAAQIKAEIECQVDRLN